MIFRLGFGDNLYIGKGRLNFIILKGEAFYNASGVGNLEW